MAALAIGLGGAIGELWVQDGLLAPKYNVRTELDGYRQMLIPLDQHWKPGTACAGTCCGLLFLPGIAILLYAKEHDSFYTIYLQKAN